MYYELIYDYSEVGTRVRNAYSIALKEAAKSPAFFRHGAVLFKRGNIYGVGFNDYRMTRWAWNGCNKPSYRTLSSGKVRLFNMHAEVACMHNIDRVKITGSNVIVVRLGRKEQVLNSRPCNFCQSVMKRKGIRKCFYSRINKIGVMKIN